MRRIKSQQEGYTQEGENIMKSKEEEVYEYIVSYMTKNLHAPSIRDICINTNIKSTSTVFYHLESLKKKGLIKTVDNQSRSIVLIGYELVKKEDLVRHNP